MRNLEPTGGVMTLRSVAEIEADINAVEDDWYARRMGDDAHEQALTRLYAERDEALRMENDDAV